jgi:hypothetical protein
MEYSDKDKMNEFDWEKEFRKDDARIASCMREIPAVVDLPGEDELLMRRVQKQPEYAKGMQRWNDSFLEELFDSDDIIFPENWRECEGADIYTRLEELMEEWCRIYASNSNDQGLRILCSYGYIMGFAIDLVDFGGEKLPGLKIALCKRIYTGLNNIISILNEWEQPDKKITAHKENIHVLRKGVIALRFQLKEKDN